MKISAAKVSDIPEIIGMIDSEFPYKGMTEKEMEERLNGSRVFVFRTKVGREVAGFVDVELKAGGKAFVNGISVLADYRRNAIGEKLMQYAIKFLKKKGVKEIQLLVKVGNFPAKKLYKKVGFRFNKYFHKKIDNSIVEEMQLTIAK